MRTTLLLVLSFLFAYVASSQLQDTTVLNTRDFSTPASVRKLIDTTYANRQADLFTTIRLAHFAYNRAVALNDRDLVAGALNLRAVAYSDLEYYDKALELLYESLRIFESTNNLHGQAMSLNNIGRIYSDAGKPEDARQYLQKAETFAATHGLAGPLLLAYFNQANNYIRLNNLQQSLAYALKAEAANKDGGNRDVSISNKNTIGALYYFLNQFDRALEYYAAARDEARRFNDSTMFYKALVNMAEVFELRQQDPLSYYTEALHHFEKTKNYAMVAYVASNIANYHKAQSRYQQALAAFEKAAAATETHKNLQAQKHMTLLQTEYETEKKAQQIALLSRENTINKLTIRGRNLTIIIISTLLLLTLIIGLLLYNRFRYRQRMLLQQQALAQREQLTRAVIEAEEKERNRIARDLHDGLGQLFTAVKLNLSGLFSRIQMERDDDRFLAEKTMALVDESCKEVRSISHQMMPNMLLRSGIASDVRSFIEKIDSESLKVNVEANGFKNRIESNAETVLYRVIQELVNNVIKHSRASRLDIILNRESNGIQVNVADNGIGFDPDSTASNGIGLQNIKARVAYLKGSLEFVSQPGAGTSVHIWVPL